MVQMLIFFQRGFLQVQKLGGYNGYFGCFHCRIVGEWFGHVYFPLPHGLRSKNKQLRSRKASRLCRQARTVAYNIIPCYLVLSRVISHFHLLSYVN